MKQFAYTYRIQYTDIISSLFFAALLFGVAVWSYLEKAGLHWKRVEIGYPDILYYTIGGGVALLVLALIFTIKMLRRKKTHRHSWKQVEYSGKRRDIFLFE